jgi:uncharacterized caspase-like protein
MRRMLLLAYVLLALAGITTPALSDQRIALVIGNANYQVGGPLATPRNDAEAVAAALRDIGFGSVQLEHNLSRDGFVQALRSFARKADKADWAVIYFAGYGIQVSGSNYLLAVDAQVERDRDVDFYGISLQPLLSVVEAASKVRLVLLDASRDARKAVLCTRCWGRLGLVPGLAIIEPEDGTLVSYAAKRDQVGVDGDGKISPYVAALLKHIKTPGLDLRVLFGNVREDVLAATAGKQEPSLYGTAPKQPLFFVDPK